MKHLGYIFPRKENNMSVDLWSWTERCDGDYCPGDCDLCRKADEVEEETDDDGVRAD